MAIEGVKKKMEKKQRLKMPAIMYWYFIQCKQFQRLGIDSVIIYRISCREEKPAERTKPFLWKSQQPLLSAAILVANLEQHYVHPCKLTEVMVLDHVWTTDRGQSKLQICWEVRKGVQHILYMINISKSLKFLHGKIKTAQSVWIWGKTTKKLSYF